MRSETSSSKARLFYPVLWKKNMARFWPVWAVCAVCWLFAMPLEMIVSRNGSVNGIPNARYFADVRVLGLIGQGAVLIAAVFGILSAMAVFSYLYNSRSVGLFHALPVRREGLFLTNYLSGLSFQILPAAAVFLVTALVEGVMGALNIGALCMWFVMLVLVTLFFYSFAVFCAMFTGHILALPVFYGILNGLAAGVMLLVDRVLARFVFGFTSVGFLGEIAAWLTPALQLVGRLWVEEIWNDGAAGLERAAFHGLGYGLVYALAGLALAGAALWIYRRRDLEGAGDVVTVKWVRPVFKYGVAFCSALALGSLLDTFFESGLPQGAWTLLAFMVLCGCAGYFAAEMLLKKSFRVFRGSWKGCVAFVLCLTAVTAGMELDVTGYERRVPDPGRVSGVSLTNAFSYPSDSAGWGGAYGEDPELIRAVTALHEAVIRERDLHENPDAGPGAAIAEAYGGAEVARETEINLSYTMPNGLVMDRRYRLWITAESLQDPNSAASQLTAILNRPEVVEKNYFSGVNEDFRLIGISLELLDTETGEYDTYPVPTGYRDELMAAVRADMAAGRLGRRYLLEDEARLENCYYNDLRLEYSYTGSNGNLYGDMGQTVTLQTTAVETLEVLREAGVVDETHVLQTQAEYREMRAGTDESGAVYAEEAGG